MFGSIDTQRGMASRLAIATGMEIVLLGYRLAPEHPSPAATDDVVAAYRALLAEASPVVAIAGDSAGGGLALLATVALRRSGVLLPPTIIAFSPWTDLAMTGERYHAGFRDVVLPYSLLAMARKAFQGGHKADDPIVSALYTDLTGLPPTLILSGGDEILLDDATRTATRLASCGVEVCLHVFPHMIHVFPVYPSLAPESDMALKEVDAFLSGHYRE